MLAAGSRYENASNRGIAHFAEHMFFKGTERRPTARDLSMEVDTIGGEFNAFTSKEYTGYYIRCAGEQRDTALDVLVDMLRNSKFDAEELEREKGVIIEEMNMYFDTPRDYVGSVYEELLFGSNPLGWETLGTKRDDQGCDARDVHRLPRPAGTRRRAWSSASPAWSATTCCRRSKELLGDMSGNGAGHAGAGRGRRARPSRRCACTARTPTRRTSASAFRRIRSTIPTGTRCSCSARCSAPACRRASSSRCASGAGLAYYVYALNSSFTDAGTLVLAGGRRPEARRGGGRGDRDGVPQARRRAGRRREELEKARALAKGRFVLQTESPNGLLLFGLRREVLEGAAVEPEELLAGLDAVTAEDVQRVAQDVIGGQGMRLRGDRPVRRRGVFEKLL